MGSACFSAVNDTPHAVGTTRTTGDGVVFISAPTTTTTMTTLNPLFTAVSPRQPLFHRTSTSSPASSATSSSLKQTSNNNKSNNNKIVPSPTALVTTSNSKKKIELETSLRIADKLFCTPMK
eukprot:PhM_4_TR8263/c0_g1_i2/m.106495